MFPHLTRPPPLDLSPLPLTYLLPTHLTPESHLEKQNLLRRCNCRLTDAAFDAQLFITAIASPQRAKLELRKKLVRVVNGGDKGGALNVDVDTKNAKDITVVRLSWLTDSLADNKLLDFEPYVVLRGRAVVETRPNTPTSTPPPRKMGQETEEEMQRKLVMESKKRKAILQAAMEEGKGKKSRYGGGRRAKEAAAEELVAFSKPVTFEAATMEKKPPALLRRSTSEYEEEEKMLEGKDMPEWIRKKNKYSCCRSTPMDQPYPNALFISQLKIILHSRQLASDSIGVRAYSTAIATLKAYPYPLTSPNIIVSLPGCDGKLAALFSEWLHSSADPETRSLTAVRDLETSSTFLSLRMFESIWGVGPDTARKFVFDWQLTDLDDLITHHWNDLSRVQQIGVKYYDEILQPISRSQVEAIAAVVFEAAKSCAPKGLEMRIVGGYRRGAPECHDVDVLLSHRVENAVRGDFILRVVRKLEEMGRVTHTLSLSYGHEHFGDHHHGRKGFDSLDKALLVYLGEGETVHRRLDIIVATATCAGTALLGWSGGTTFQRDMRLWCEKEKGWKFASEGVWNGNKRVDGTYGWRDEETWEDVEKRVMERMGIGWRPPSERCTG